MDYFSKWVDLIPLWRASVKTTVVALLENFIVKYFLVSLKVVSDNGRKLVSEVYEQMCQQLNIAYIRKVPYMPQCNLTESTNRT